MTSPHVTAIVLNWRACAETLAVIRQLQSQSHPALQILVVDNGSGDGSAERLRQHTPPVTLIALPENRGFAAGVNQALRLALATPADYILLLNNDTLIAPDTVARLAQRMQSLPQVGIATPKIYYADRPGQLWGVGGAMRPHWMVVFGMDEPDHGQHDARPLDFVFGCAMIIRRSVVEQIGLLDERFFVYYEDADYCLRARQAGFAVALLPDIHIEHAGSHSTRQQLAWRAFLHIRNRMVFFHKHLHGPARWRFFLRESLYIASVLGRSLLRGDLRGAHAYLLGLAQGIAHGMQIQPPASPPALVHHGDQ